MALDSTEENLFFLTSNMVVKYPVHYCSSYLNRKNCKIAPEDCGWCKGKCMPKETSLRKCGKTAFLELISPTSGPLEGGTLLRLKGSFGRNDVDNVEEQVSFTVDGKICRIIRWIELLKDLTQPWIVECRTGEGLRETKNKVEMRISHQFFDSVIAREFSKEEFEYKTPKLCGVEPEYGPKSGGTNVTLHGENLNIGSDRRVDLSGIYCHIYGVNSTHILCTSSPAEIGKELSGSVTLWIDKNPVKPQFKSNRGFSKIFEYRSNPTVGSIYPNSTIYSGKTRITISGTNLDSVVKPQLLVTVTINGQKIKMTGECNCSDLYGIELTCSTPPLKNALDQIPATTTVIPVLASVNLIMDGVRKEDLHQENDNNSLWYFQDPNFRPKEYVFQKDRKLVIPIGNFTLGVHSDDVQVKASDMPLCEFTKIESSSIICQVSDNARRSFSKRSTNTQQSIPLNVFIGGYKSSLGNISEHWMDEPSHRTKEQSHITFITLFIVIASAGTLLSLIILIILVYLRHKKTSKLSEKSEVLQPLKNDDSTKDHKEILIVTGLSGYTSCKKRIVLNDSEVSELRKSGINLMERQFLRLENVIYSGRFSRISKACFDKPGLSTMPVAVKEIKEDSREAAIALMDYVRLMKKFKHPRVLNFLGVIFKSNGMPMAIVPLMENGNLRAYLLSKKKEITIKQLISFGEQTADGMNYLSKTGFVHGNLSSGNCLLDAALFLKIAGFDLGSEMCRKRHSIEKMNTALSITWKAPEWNSSRKASSQADVWSFGVFLLELATGGELPDYDCGVEETIKQLVSDQTSLKQDTFLTTMFSLMLKCWNPNPKMRPTFKQLLCILGGLLKSLPDLELEVPVHLNCIPGAWYRCAENDADSDLNFNSKL